jgi:hypothetical protein
MSALLMYFTSWKHSFLKRHHHAKPKLKMPKVLKKIHAWLHEGMQQVQLGGMLGLKNV